jgi:hypothetical protein
MSIFFLNKKKPYIISIVYNTVTLGSHLFCHRRETRTGGSDLFWHCHDCKKLYKKLQVFAGTQFCLPILGLAIYRAAITDRIIQTK